MFNYIWITEYRGYLENTDTRTRKRGHGHADMENADMENADMENTDMENADGENADMENADKHIKNFCMVDGLPCNCFGLPEKFHVFFKY